MKTLGHRTLVETFECPLTGLTIEMVRPGRRHKQRVAAIMAEEWGDREPVDLLRPPETEDRASREYLEYLDLWQFTLAAICMRIEGEDEPVGFDLLSTWDSEITELWVARFLVFTGFLVETAPGLDELDDLDNPGAGQKKKEPSSPSRWKSFVSRWVATFRSSTRPGKSPPSTSPTSGSSST